MAGPIKVMLVDDHQILRAGLRMLINAQPDMTVVSEAGNGEEAWLRLSQVPPDVLVIDLSMPHTNTPELLERIHLTHSSVRMLVLTMHEDGAYLRSSLGAGASGFLVKKAADAELISAVRALAAGRTFVDADLRGEPLTPDAQAEPAAVRRRSAAAHLSRRELQVMTLLTAGHTYEEIARRLAVTVKTVETYRTRLGQKLGVRTRAQFVAYALKMGLLHPTSS